LPDLRCTTRADLARYLALFPDEAAALARLARQLAAGDDCFVRSNLTGHVTTSAAVLSPDLSHLLLIHHPVFKQWQPPGGHYELPGTLLSSAMREVAEETGVTDLQMHPWTARHGVPLQLASYPIPANPAKGEGAHWHHDACYLLVAPRCPLAQPADAVAWWPRAALAQLGEQDLARKLARVLGPA
jgi:8-oxo-dGTP pyrophosphatase MutT (NUDIX family)